MANGPTNTGTKLEVLQGALDLMASWGDSENNRKARFHAISAAGRHQLARELETWDRLATLIGRFRWAQQT